MATNIDGLGGLNKSDGNAYLLAAFGPDLVDVINNAGYSENLTSGNNAEFIQYLDNLFFTNYKDQPRHFTGTDWATNLLNKMPMAKFWAVYGSRLYFAFYKLPVSDSETWDRDPIDSGVDDATVTFPSRVGYFELPFLKNELQSGLHWSAKYKTIANNDNKLFLTTPIINVGFKDVKIKSGDKVNILDGSDESQGEYTVVSVDSNTQLTLDRDVPKQLTNASGFIGSNFFDIDTDDGDFLTGMALNNDKLLAFKRYTLHRYDGTSRRQIKGVPGTTSSRSIQNVSDKFTIYFHGSLGNRTGFYMTDGVSASKISNALEKHIEGIASSFYSSVVAWTEGNLYRAYIGTVTNTNFGISLSNAVWTYDIETGTQTIDTIGKAIKAGTQLEQSGRLNTYTGDEDSSVFRMGIPTNYQHDTAAIGFDVETRVVYPKGPEGVNTFTRCQVIARNAASIKVYYKLYNHLNDVDEDWNPLGDIKYDKTEFIFPARHRYASGISYRFVDLSGKEADYLIEKVSTFYKSEGAEDAQLPR